MIVFDSIKSIEFILFPFLFYFFHGKKEELLDFFQEQVTAGRNKIHKNLYKRGQTYIIRTRTFLYCILLLLLLLVSSSSSSSSLSSLLLLLGKCIRLILSNIVVTILNSEILDHFVLLILKSEFLNSVTQTKPKYYKEDNLILL